MNKRLLLFALSLITTHCVLSQTPAFPGAEGFGRYATGGRGGKVVIVSNLNDDGKGSFRQALKEYPNDPITVVFAAGGIIDLKSPVKISRSDITIAGQTAPGDGICLRGNSFVINCASDKGNKGNIIIRYLRSRPGPKKGAVLYAFNMENAQNIIIDHCSFSWANEEVAAMYDVKNITVQWSIISEGLYNAGHHKGVRSYGGVWGGQNASFHHNLIAHQNSRTIRFNGSRAHDTLALVDYRNNVIYNWGSPNAAYGGEVEIPGGRSLINIVNNYYKPGQATSKTLKFVRTNYNAPKAKGVGQWYVNGNTMHGDRKLTADNLAGVDQSELPSGLRKDAVASTPFHVSENIAQQPADKAFLAVLKNAGVSFPVRDAVDKRIVSETRSGTAAGTGTLGNGIIDDPQAVGGWPQYKSGTAPADSDKDGMPDAWEMKHHLNPNDSSDASLFTINKNYTNIEVYINGLLK